MRQKRLAIATTGLVFVAGCAAMNPQGAARQPTEAYYGRPYEQMSAQEKMQLENHLARQSNTAWRTTAHMAAGLGRLMQGAGILILGAKR